MNTHTDFVIINIPNQSGRLITINKSLLTYYYHPIHNYMRVSFWYYIFYEFKKFITTCIHDYNINMELFHCPKIFLGFAYLSLPLSKLSATTSVAGSIASAFSTTSRLLMTKNQKYNY